MSRRCQVWLLILAGVGAACRLPALWANSFHADEALFAGWARLIAVWRDPLLQTQLVDKPPLLFYLQALFYPLFGPVEWAARLPAYLTSLMLVPLVGQLAWRLYQKERTALVAAAFVALSPLAIQFSATAFLDPLLTTLLVAALTAAAGRPAAAWSGLFFGLAVATKYQAWLFWPLLAALAALGGWRWREWRRWLVGFLPLLGLLWLWSVSRAGSPTLWSAQMASYGGIRPIWSWEVWPRLAGWLELLYGALGSWPAAPALLLCLLLLAVLGWRGRGPAGAFDQLFLLYLAGYCLLHWLLAVPVWDRYLLPILPLLALAGARGLSRLLELLRPRFGSSRLEPAGVAVAALLLLAQLPAAAGARDGRFPIGGQAGADQGAAAVARYLADAPYGTVLYDHWFSWQWRYHLFDRRVYVGWFPHGQALVRELLAFGADGNRHYLALPNSTVADPIRRSVRQAGFSLQPLPEASSDGIILYQIEPVSQ